MENLLAGISEEATGGAIVFVVGIVVMFLSKKFNLKRFLGVASNVTKEIGEAFLESSDVFGTANKAIKEDGSFNENSIDDIIREGKEAIIEWKDVQMIVKPKKKSIKNS